MAGSIYDWSQDPGDNGTSDAEIDWREGVQLPSSVNDSARAMMARVAEFRDDLTGTLVAGGSANSITLTANSAFTALANGLALAFRAAHDNTGSATINVNALGSKQIRRMTDVGDVALIAGSILEDQVCHIIYSESANGGSGAWILTNPVTMPFPSGTRMLFQQTSAPPGWTKVTGGAPYHNSALRVTTGTVDLGGDIAFTSVFSSHAVTGSVEGHALTTSQMPEHDHGNGNLATGGGGAHTHTASTSSAGAHTHSVSGGRSGFSTASTQALTNFTGGDTSGTTSSAGNHTHNVTVNSAGNHTHNVTGRTSTAGSGNEHSHNFSGGTIDLSVRYVDVIVAEKD